MRKYLSLSATAALAALALAACGGSGSSDNGVASKSPDAILRAASQAIGTVSSVHMLGTISSGGSSESIDLYLVAGKGATGQISSHGLTAKLIAVGNSVYINGGQSFWQSFVNPAIASRLAGRWLKGPESGSFSSIAQFTKMRSLFSQGLATHGPLAKGQMTTVHGQKVVGVDDTTEGGTLYVATTGQPYPVEIVKTGSQAGSLMFDDFNQPVSLSAPANALSITSLGL